MYHKGGVKLCDFGLAKTIEQSRTLNATTVGGTPIYMPPEMYSNYVNYNALKGDVFSMGLVFLGTLTCQKGGKMDDFFRPGEKLNIDASVVFQSVRL